MPQSSVLAFLFIELLLWKSPNLVSATAGHIMGQPLPKSLFSEPPHGKLCFLFKNWVRMAGVLGVRAELVWDWYEQQRLEFSSSCGP